MLRYLAFKQIWTLFFEIVVLVLCVLLAHYVQSGDSPLSLNSIGQDLVILKALWFALLFQLFLHLNDIYDFKATQISKRYLVRLCESLFMASLSLCVLFYLVPVLTVEPGILVLSLIFSIVFLVIWHTLLRVYFWKRSPYIHLIVLGTNALAREIAREISRRPELGMRVLGFVDDSPESVDLKTENPKVLGNYRDLSKLTADERVKGVIVGSQDRRSKLPMAELLNLKIKGVAVEDANAFYEHLVGKIPVENLKPSWIVFNPGFKVSKIMLLNKQLFSMIVAAILLVILSPIILILMILIKLDSSGPIFYRQKRVGLDGKIFTLWKLRSMKVDTQDDLQSSWDTNHIEETRVTRVGRFLRGSRLDELPQLFNVLKGDMSIIGPRPERPGFVEKLKETIPFYDIRHMVKPGITGWAQVNCEYANSVELTLEKLQYDLFYVKNMSWYLDLLIIIETIKTVLVKKGS